jgi:hypothetical protein
VHSKIGREDLDILEITLKFRINSKIFSYYIEFDIEETVMQ